MHFHDIINSLGIFQYTPIDNSGQRLKSQGYRQAPFVLVQVLLAYGSIRLWFRTVFQEGENTDFLLKSLSRVPDENLMCVLSTMLFHRTSILPFWLEMEVARPNIQLRFPAADTPVSLGLWDLTATRASSRPQLPRKGAKCPARLESMATYIQRHTHEHDRWKYGRIFQKKIWNERPLYLNIV